VRLLHVGAGNWAGGIYESGYIVLIRQGLAARTNPRHALQYSPAFAEESFEYSLTVQSGLSEYGR
jgi:hypothetical protein